MSELRGIRTSELAGELIANISVGQPVMLWGGGGIGKSSIWKQVAEQLELGRIDLRVNLLEPVDFRGIPYVQNGISRWAPPEFFPRVERDGPRGLLVLDELPNAPKATQAACYQLILDKRCGDYELPPGWIPVAAGNRMSDRGGTFEMPAPLKNRFAHYEVEPLIDDWVVWARLNGIHAMIIAFLRFRPNLLYLFDPDNIAFPTPRTWEMLSRRLQAAPAQTEYYAIQSLVGPGAAGEFLTFKKTFNSMPDLDNLIAYPNKAHVPVDDPASMYAIATALAFRATKKNIDSVLIYATRMPPEFQVMLVKDAVTRNKELASTREFAEWATKNANVIL